jgi:hypothetical protein
MTTTVRTTTLEVRISDAPTAVVPDPPYVLDSASYAASCSFGFDQRYAEATVRRTGGGTVAVQYWSRVEITMGCTPGAGPAVRFRGYVVPIDNSLYPIDNVLTCRGYLYRAAWVKNRTPGGTLMAPFATGRPDEDQVKDVLTYCAVPFTPSNIAGTGKALGYQALDPEQALTPGPFTWAEGSSGLDYIEQLDEVSVPDPVTPTGTPAGRYRTFESLAGDVFRIPIVTEPDTAADFSFAEGVDVLDARITRDPTGAANRVTVTGAPTPERAYVGGAVDVTLGWEARWTVSSAFAPYLPAGLPADPDGHAYVGASFTSQMIQKSTIAEPTDVVSCEAVARFLLGEYNCVLDTLEFSTPRDDLLGPGQTVHLDSDRLGLTDPTRHYWVQHLEVVMDERGAFTQRLRCLRRS